MNRLSLTKLISTIFFLAITTYSYCQKKDFGSWNEFSLEKKFNKKFSLILQEDFRLKNNATQFNSAVTVFGAQYTINKTFKIRALYRYTASLDIEDGPEYNNRIYIDGLVKQKIKRLTFNYRLRYQLNIEKNTPMNWNYLRNRVGVKYNVPKSKLLPYAEYEFYYSLNNSHQNSVERNRYTFGLEYGLNKSFTVYSYYRIQFDRDYFHKPSNNYILGLGLSIDI